jgi:hypothetical protein
MMLLEESFQLGGLWESFAAFSPCQYWVRLFERVWDENAGESP